MNRIILAIFVLVATCGDIWGQATAQISGSVKDQSGAALPGVEITVTQTDTGVTRSAVTNETGSYILQNLPIGSYRLEASLPGFRSYVQTGIVLQVNASPLINPVLSVGQVTEEIEVTANATLVETRTVGVGQVVENASILELPLNGRNVVDLLTLSGAATPTAIAGSGRNPFVSSGASIAGGLGTSLNYTLDGANHNNAFENTFLSMPFPDAMQEFKVETSATGAQNGVRTAGTVSLVTKSGTNAFHGDLFEFVRNGIFNARNAFALKRDSLKRNQFGGTVGGPIKQNKLFFFAGYQGTTVRSDPVDTLTFVPTAAMLAGDFTTFASPACNVGRQITLRAPFVNNRIDPALFSKAAVALSKLVPKSNDPCGSIIRGNQSTENDHMAVGKVDYQRSANHSLFGRYLVDSVKRPDSFSLNHNLLSAGNGDDGLTQAFTLGDTYLFGANIVNSLRLTANRWVGGRIGSPFNSWPELGVKMYDYGGKALSATITGGFTVNRAGIGSSKVGFFVISDDVSVVRGNHQVAVGGQASAWRSNSYSDHYTIGRATFTGQKTGQGMADFLIGSVSAWTMGTPAVQNKRDKYFGAYVNDAWKLNQKLTLNYGLRWEPYYAQYNQDGGAIHYDHDALVKGTKTSQFKNAPPGLFFPGDPGFPGRSVMHNQLWNFGPRLGLAWDLAGDGRTSVRASVGTFFAPPSSYYQVGLSNAPPTSQRNITNDVNLDNPWATYPGGDPFPTDYGRNVTSNAPWPLNAVVTAIDYETPIPRVYQWNLSVQRQINSNWFASVSYLGNESAHMWGLKQLNPAVFLGLGPCTLNSVSYTACSTTGNTQDRRVLSLENVKTGQYFGTVNLLDPSATANYNGLVLSTQYRAARGLTINVTHTWSRCITDHIEENTANTGNADGGYLDPNNRRVDRGNCNTDRRQVLNFTAVASTPQFANPTLRAVASNWRLSPIFKILSGSSMTVLSGQDRALTALANQRADQIVGSPYGDKTIGKYLNPAAFAQPALGKLGNVGSNSVLGPGTWQFDIALSRTFQFGEVRKVEFRTEAFNVTNSFLMNNPVLNLNSGTFGRVTSSKDPRIMQFALKYFF